MEFRLEHTLPANIAYAWQTVMSEDFAEKSYAQSGIERRLISSEERNGKVYILLHVKVLERMPGVAAKVLGSDQLEWNQRQIIDHSTHTMQWQIEIPNAKQVSAQGTFTLLPRGAECVRVVDGDVRVKIPLVGRKAEEHVCAKLRKSYEDSALFTQQWLRANPQNS